jgi:hypothetical protein
MTFEEAKADWLETLAKHPGTGHIPALGVWAAMCDMPEHAFRTQCRKTHPVEVARHALFRAIYAQERAAEYQRRRGEGETKIAARAGAGICATRARVIEPPTKLFHDWPTLLEGARAWLAEPRTTHQLAEKLDVDPQGLHNLRARGLPRWLRVTKEGAFLRWQAKRLKSRG